jgi:hypothetical protein
VDAWFVNVEEPVTSNVKTSYFREIQRENTRIQKVKRHLHIRRCAGHKLVDELGVFDALSQESTLSRTKAA